MASPGQKLMRRVTAAIDTRYHIVPQIDARLCLLIVCHGADPRCLLIGGLRWVQFKLGIFPVVGEVNRLKNGSSQLLGVEEAETARPLLANPTSFHWNSLLAEPRLSSPVAPTLGELFSPSPSRGRKERELTRGPDPCRLHHRPPLVERPAAHIPRHVLHALPPTGPLQELAHQALPARGLHELPGDVPDRGEGDFQGEVARPAVPPAVAHGGRVEGEDPEGPDVELGVGGDGGVDVRGDDADLVQSAERQRVTCLLVGRHCRGMAGGRARFEE